MLQVEVVYVPPSKKALCLKLSCPDGTTVKEALDASGVYTLHPETQTFPLGIFSKKISPCQVLKSGDRIELYRPLALDPKEKRRQLARKRK